MREQTFWRWARERMSPDKTRTLPACIFFWPAMMLRSVDLPTPSGPMNPTWDPEGIRRPISESACFLP